MSYIARAQDLAQHPHPAPSYVAIAGGGGSSAWLVTVEPWLAIGVGVLSMIALAVRIGVDVGWIRKRQ